MASYLLWTSPNNNPHSPPKGGHFGEIMTTQTEFNAEVQRLVRLFAARDTDEDEIWLALEEHEWVLSWEDNQAAAYTVLERLIEAVMEAS